MSDYVLDAFALLAFFQNEPGRPRVEELFRSAERSLDTLHVTVVNLGEMYYKLRHSQGVRLARRAMLHLDHLSLRVTEVDRGLAMQAAYAKADRRLGYLDCFVFALAHRLEATVVTGDSDFKRVEDLVAIDWLPQPERP